MNTYAPESKLQKILKAFQASMLALTLVTMSFPVSAFATDGGESEAPAPIVLDCAAEGKVLNEAGDGCVEAPAPADAPLECVEPLVLNEEGTECVEAPAPEVLGARLSIQEDGPYEDTDKDGQCVVE